MSYERPAWASTAEVPQTLPSYKMVNIDVGELIRTRDALTSAYLGLSTSIDRAVKAYLDHTQVVLNGDAALNVSHLMQPFNVLTSLVNPAQVAQMALQQQNGTVAPMMITNGLGPGPVTGGAPPVGAAIPGASEEPLGADGKKKRKKRAYKQRDPNAPKRPLTAYFRYLGENRAGIAKEIQDNPDQFAASGKPGDISRVATDRWNALSKDQQEPYRAAYQAALKEYEKEVERYKLQGGKPEDLDDARVDESIIDATVAATVAANLAAEESEAESEEEVIAPPPPPVEKSPRKATSKKSKAAAAAAAAPAAAGFSSINPTPAVAIAPAAAAVTPASPARKRKAAADVVEGSSKKRGRKSEAEKEVVAAADPVPVAVPVPVAPSSPEVETAGKKKKDKKKRKSGDA